MGNEESRNSRQCKAEAIKEPEKYMKKIDSTEQTFANDIQDQNEKNVNQRKTNIENT